MDLQEAFTDICRLELSKPNIRTAAFILGPRLYVQGILLAYEEERDTQDSTYLWIQSNRNQCEQIVAGLLGLT